MAATCRAVKFTFAPALKLLEMIAPSRSGWPRLLIEALNFVPDFLEDLVSDDLLDALSSGVIQVVLRDSAKPPKN